MATYEGGSYVIREFSDGSSVFFSRGRFDKWCVYCKEENGKRRAPLDSDYFTDLRTLAEKYGVDRIYHNFVAVFRETNHVDLPEARVLNAIYETSLWYGEDALKFEKTMVVLYATMVAEEKKQFSKIGKYLKHLAVYELLFCGETTCALVTKFNGVKADGLWKAIVGHGLAPEGSAPILRTRLPKSVRNVSDWYESGAWKEAVAA